MFKWLSNYYNNITDTPSIYFYLNSWVYTNSFYFKFNLNKLLTFFISIDNLLKHKFINIFYKNFFMFKITFIFLLLCVFIFTIVIFI